MKGREAGVLEVTRPDAPLDDGDRALYTSFASQLSIALENARLYQQIDSLFRSYLSPDVVTRCSPIRARPTLGGTVEQITVLMADLRGFTPFSERSAPGDIVTMLNTYFGILVPIVLDEGGTITQFVGDAVMGIFNAPARQPDHALRSRASGAARAGRDRRSRGRQSRLAAVPHGHQHRTRADRQHRQRRPPRLHRDRRHGELWRPGSRARPRSRAW